MTTRPTLTADQCAIFLPVLLQLDEHLGAEVANAANARWASWPRSGRAGDPLDVPPPGWIGGGIRNAVDDANWRLGKHLDMLADVYEELDITGALGVYFYPTNDDTEEN